MTTNQSSDAVIKNIEQIRLQVEKALTESGRSQNEVTIMAVTKTVDPELVNTAISQGITLLGENRVQEFLSKEEAYDLENAEVHFIGHLQSNKVKYIIDKVTMIESVSSEKLAGEISRAAVKAGKVMDVLLEVNIGSEESKSGFLKEELLQALPRLSQLPGMKVRGLMCIPPKDDGEKYFSLMQQLFIDIKEKKLDNINMDVLSMGMSGDYTAAIRHGATIIRLGTAMFGARDYR